MGEFALEVRIKHDPDIIHENSEQCILFSFLSIVVIYKRNG